MREILFRGKRVDNGEWVVGYYTKGFRYPNETQLLDMIYAFIKNGNAFEFECFAVDTYTVGQYTGLCDKNGTKIFEGDVVEFNNMENEPYSKDNFICREIVVYDNLSACYRPTETVPSDFVLEDTDIKVIGNIYDNPELLRGENEK